VLVGLSLTCATTGALYRRLAVREGLEPALQFRIEQVMVEASRG
jgi:hypothetical protein